MIMATKSLQQQRIVSCCHRLLSSHGKSAITTTTAAAAAAASSTVGRTNITTSSFLSNPQQKQNGQSMMSSSTAAAVADDSIENHPSLIKKQFRQHLEEEKAKALIGGGLKRIEKQHAKGSLTARERLEILFDEGTFHELDKLKAHRCTEFNMDQPDKHFPGDGIVTGHGLINGKVVYAFSQGTEMCVFFWIASFARLSLQKGF